jgi:hypothetical protein
MAFVTADRTADTTTTVGTSPFVVSGTAPIGSQTFSAVMSVGDTCYYSAQHQTLNEWEVGLATYSSANTLTRTTIYSSSNAGSAVTFSAGTKDVFITMAASRSIQLDASGNVTPATGTYTRTTITATAGQTSFTANYTVNYVQVYVNGILLNSADYTATTGTTVVLASAAAAGDIVDVLAINIGTFTGGVTITGTPTNGQIATWTGSTSIQGITTGTGVATALGVNTGVSGAFVVNGGALGTPSSGTLTSVTGLPLTTGVTGLLPIANGGLAASVSPTTAGNTIFSTDGTNWSSTAKIVRGTAVASTSGTSIDFTSIPSWVKRITIVLQGVSTNGTSVVELRIGSGSITATGYSGGAVYTVNIAATGGAVTQTTGFQVPGNSAGNIRSGVYTLINISGNIWVASGCGGFSEVAASWQGGGNLTLGGTLDRVRLTTVNGTDTFDAGSVNILYE